MIRALFARPRRGPRGRPRRAGASNSPPKITRTIQGRCTVIDGDTVIIQGTRLRLFGIDAPELDHPYGQKSKWAVIRMCQDQVVTAELHESVSYDRKVARCVLPDGRDIGAELVRMGLALDWPKFSGGRYGHLEPAGIRRKLWRADARQKGRMPQAR
ncbi:MAG TPA: thermonuclease family protein [Pararhodobacter sp.]|nr:thermonuclease family protein [Pararhodobacter sp.]